MPRKDPEARAQYLKERYEADPERFKRESIERYQKMKDDPDYRAKRKEQAERWKKETGRDVYLASRKRRYEADKPARQADARERMTRRRERELPTLISIVSEAKRGGCSRCPEGREHCLDFHHLDPLDKSFTIGKEIQRLVKPDKLHSEIAKCEVVCASCHIIHHHDAPSPNRKPLTEKGMRGLALRRKKEERWESYLDRCRANGCTLCDQSDPRTMQFHHIYPEWKEYNIWQYTVRPIRFPLPDEVHKCVVLCANCHRCVEAGVETLPEIDLDIYWANRLGCEA